LKNAISEEKPDKKGGVEKKKKENHHGQVKRKMKGLDDAHSQKKKTYPIYGMLEKGGTWREKGRRRRTGPSLVRMLELVVHPIRTTSSGKQIGRTEKKGRILDGKNSRHGR